MAREKINFCLTHVKSCRITLAGLNGISTLSFCFCSHARILSTSFLSTWKSSQFLTADSSNTRMENGSLSITNNKYGYEQLLLIQNVDLNIFKHTYSRDAILLLEWLRVFAKLVRQRKYCGSLRHNLDL